MSAFNPIPPRRAAAIIEEAQLGDPMRILVDFAAAGLVKGYARLIETAHADGTCAEVRDSRVPREVWKRIIEQGCAADILAVGTVRLPGSHLRGGEPSMSVIGIRFDDVSLQAVIEQHSAEARPLRALRAAPGVITPPQPVAAPAAISAQPAAAPRSQSPAASIPEGAVTVTVQQAMAALGLGRTKVNQLMGQGRLTRVKVDTRTLITVDSIRTLLS
ncbi:hypothetical protein LQ953_13435 [Sphingomonas sp. IC-56]|uniref:hypothetical protein n=1 Tax=Sphingomonas sp. IC-56 TaxID=2898529 RepID=UPI001E3544C8|nr:hypothetical protein [Sphingomonas sp. IC-56]MCD2325021.1 hypothetical protein [Sphingomonas sp. IC-56]